MIRYARTYNRPDRFATLEYGSWRGLSVRVWSRSANGFVQKPVTSAPNAYTSLLVQVPTPPTSTVGTDSSYCSYAISPSGSCYQYGDLAYNKAYKNFVRKIHGTTANLALTMIDSKKSFAMISSRLITLISAFRSLKKGRLGDMAKTLKIGLLPQHSNVSAYKPRRGFKRSPRYGKTRDVANTWLEYSFGWSPLIQDIHDACKVLSNPMPSPRVKASGTSNFHILSAYIEPAYTSQSVHGFVRCTVRSRVRITNPNLLLLNQAGLINPAFVLWDAIPFSFVVDWILPVGSYLKSWTDFVGLELIEPHYTLYWVAYDEGPNYYSPGYTRRSNVRKVERVIGLPPMKFPSFGGRPDLWKASISASLLVQKFHNELTNLTSVKKRSYFG